MAQSLLPSFANYTPDAIHSPDSVHAVEPAWQIAFGIVGVFGVLIAILNINCENSFLAKLWAYLRSKRPESDIEKDGDDHIQTREELRRLTGPGSLSARNHNLFVRSARTSSHLIDESVASQAVESTPALVDGIGIGTAMSTLPVPLISHSEPALEARNDNEEEMLDTSTSPLTMHAYELEHLPTAQYHATPRQQIAAFGIPQHPNSSRLEPSAFVEAEFGAPYEVVVTSHGSSMSSYTSPITSVVDLEAFMVLEKAQARTGLWRLFDVFGL